MDWAGRSERKKVRLCVPVNYHIGVLWQLVGQLHAWHLSQSPASSDKLSDDRASEAHLRPASYPHLPWGRVSKGVSELQSMISRGESKVSPALDGSWPLKKSNRPNHRSSHLGKWSEAEHTILHGETDAVAELHMLSDDEVRNVASSSTGLTWARAPPLLVEDARAMMTGRATAKCRRPLIGEVRGEERRDCIFYIKNMMDTLCRKVLILS